ncbi:hypothetical protein ACHHYP_16971 [Achlya hypogyna]|uniref:Transmembrane protein n=1 Tax=Achlya hypogyna TaxID=1202772 RepID=A0A1V9Y5H1_ACHHY|nr:hypothetical protein ACHHYP_16971 [Achlya hypogyna]
MAWIKMLGHRRPCVLDLLYVGISMGCSIWYLVILSSYMANDLFWPGFALTGAHTYLLDLCSLRLWLTSNGTLDLFDSSQAITKAYNTPAAMLLAQSTYPRAVLFGTTSMHRAIAAFHSDTMSVRVVLEQYTQYCWVDFDRRWELGHTQARQKRCAVLYETNGAMYLETILRNVNWALFSNRFGESFSFAVSDAVAAAPGGTEWLSSVQNAFVSIDSEVAYWSQHGLKHYTLQWSNMFLIGVQETITVVNAFGWEQQLATMTIAYAGRGSLWTTAINYWLFFNDLWAASVANGSLVRSAPNFMGNNTVAPTVTVEDILGIYPYTPCSVIVHNYLGPFVSIDTFYVAPPASLIALATDYQALLASALQTKPLVLHSYQELAQSLLDPVPTTWRNSQYTHYGGSPMCVFGTGSTYVQRQISFEDSCATQLPSTLTLSGPPQAFAVVATTIVNTSVSVQEICQLCTSTSTTCAAALRLALSFRDAFAPTARNTLVPAVRAVEADVSALGVELIQFSLANGTQDVVLRQPLLSEDWTFFGFHMLHEWVWGYREVISFQGDVATFVLMSERIEGFERSPSPTELPTSTCKYLWYISVAATVGLVFVATITAGYVVVGGCRLDGHELLRFNRVVGPVWIGRPMLLVRSVTALVILSTPPVTFHSLNGLGYFAFEPRSFVDVVLVTGEATWLTYVVTDVLLVATPTEAARSGPLSSSLVWLVTFAIEMASPVRPTATLNRDCSQGNIEEFVACSSGVVQFGARDRIILIGAVNTVCIMASIAFVHGYLKTRRLKVRRPARRATYLVSAAAEAFLTISDDIWSVDAAVGSMSGLFHFQWRRTAYVFDTKLWICFKRFGSGPCVNVVPLSAPPCPSPYEVPVSRGHALRTRVTLFLGISYLVATVVGSISFLQLSNVNLANDFWWVGFNATGMQAFVANWYSQYLYLAPDLDAVQLDVGVYADMKTYATNGTTILLTAMYPRLATFEVGSDVALAIHGLRTMDACQVPWISTQYCWLDFAQRWPMANSQRRQERCQQRYATNGAVYLEAPLRNLNWAVFGTCWGDSFDVAFAKDLRRDAAGTAWLALTRSHALSEADEALLWRSNGIESFSPAWQNYKSVGLHNTYGIANALGIVYPFTLQSVSGSFQLAKQTSLKMYWTLASDLWAVATNGTGMTGRSLLRAAANFAFANTTQQAVLLLNGTLTAPLDPAYACFEANIGPFGSVDLRHVPYPLALRQLVRDVREDTNAVLVSSTNASGAYPAQDAYLNLVIMQGMVPTPSVLNVLTELSAGSNLLCNRPPSSLNLTTGLLSYFGVDVPCNSGMGEWVYPVKEQILFALIASGMVARAAAAVPVTCSIETTSPANCEASLNSVAAFATTYFSASVLAGMSATGDRVRQDIANLGVELAAYIQDTTTGALRLFHQPILTSADQAMLFYGWTYAYDWATGSREVTAFNGDNSMLAIISTTYETTTLAPSAAEVPVNVAAYFRVFCQYISFMLLVVAVIAVLYSGINGFTSEGNNLFEVNRVGGMVWIGRPLLVLRSTTALCILSTATLQLHVNGIATYPISTRVDVSTVSALTTKVLAAGELCWLVYIFDDLCMVFTQQYTASYTNKAAPLVWAVAAALSLAVPVVHSATVARTCEVGAVDFELACSNGVVQIGSPRRFFLLVVVAICGSIMLYIHDRLRYTLAAPAERPSYLLSCGAKYLFSKAGWVFGDVYYIDYASAALTGLLVLPHGRTRYVFDIKTWRTLAVDMDAVANEALRHPALPRLAAALPLVD